MLHAIPGLRSLSLTTNGVLLTKLAGPLAEAGLTRINVSLDSLVRERFAELTRRDALAQVLAGLEELEQLSQRSSPSRSTRWRCADSPNRGARLRRGSRAAKPMSVRWIEFMPLDADQIWRKEDILTGGEIKAIIEANYGPLARITTGDPSETARRYTFADGIGEVGFINPVSEPFCASCDRIRLTAEGQLRTCLFAHEETDLRASCAPASDDEALAHAIRQAVWHKELKHHIGDKRFRRTARTMSMIGG